MAATPALSSVGRREYGAVSSDDPSVIGVTEEYSIQVRGCTEKCWDSDWVPCSGSSGLGEIVYYAAVSDSPSGELVCPIIVDEDAV